MPQLSKHQEKVIAALRKGIDGTIGQMDEDDERRDSVLVSNKAVDVELLLDVIDELRTAAPA